MGTLAEDIKTQSDWIIKAFAADKLILDHSISSFMEIDKFFLKHSKNGKPVRNGRLAQNLGPIIFSIGSYIGETFIHTIPGSKWIVNDDDPEGEINATVKLPDGAIIFPMQRVMKRYSNGLEDSIYVYGHRLAKDFINEPFIQSFWELGKNNAPGKPWWKFS